MNITLESVVLIGTLFNAFGIIGAIVGIFKWVMNIEIRLKGIETAIKERSRRMYDYKHLQNNEGEGE